MMYYKPTPMFRADVREITHGLIIRTIYIRYINASSQTTYADYNVPCIASSLRMASVID